MSGKQKVLIYIGWKLCCLENLLFWWKKAM